MSPWLSKGTRLSRAPPSPNSLERSSCSLWAWAQCFPGSWSSPFPDTMGACSLDAGGGGGSSIPRRSL